MIESLIMRITFATLTAFLLLVLASGQTFSAPTPKPTAKPTPKVATASKAQQQKQAELKASAPADEYFGRMKLSFLGINNTFRDQAIRAGDHTIDSTVTGPVGWAEDALRAWERKYGKDPQLARTYYLAFLADRKIWLVDFQRRATYYLVQLRQKFPSTFFGKQAKADLQKGMTMNFFAQPLPCVTIAPRSSSPAPLESTPAPLATDDPKNNIKVNEIPVPCYTIAPSPSPTIAPPSPAVAPQVSPSSAASASPSPAASASRIPSATSH